MLETLLSRLPQTATVERELVTSALKIPENLKAKAADILADVNLSDVGRREKIKALASGDSLAHLRQIRNRVEGLKADVANLKKGLEPKAPDRDDLYSEQQKREIRDWLRSRPEAERFRAAIENPEIAAAVLHAPAPQLTGLTQEQIDRVREKQIETAHGPQLRGLERREELIEVLDAAIKIAGSEFQKASGLSEAEIA